MTASVGKKEVELFASDYARMTVQWCLDYFARYRQAPREMLETMLRTDVDGRVTRLSPEGQELLAEFLKVLSADLKRNGEITHTAFLVDKTNKYLTSQRMLRCMDRAKQMVAEGKLAEAELELKNYHAVGTASLEMINVFEDIADTIAAANEASQPPLFKFGHAFGTMVDEHMIRQGLVAYLANGKGGKTFMLIEHALQAMRKGLNVVFFEIGDLTSNQLRNRMASNRFDVGLHLSTVYRNQGLCRLLE